MDLSVCRTVPLSYLPEQLAHQEGLLSVHLKLRLWADSSGHWITARIRKVLSLASPFLHTHSPRPSDFHLCCLSSCCLLAPNSLFHTWLCDASAGTLQSTFLHLTSMVKAIRLCSRRHWRDSARIKRKKSSLLLCLLSASCSSEHHPSNDSSSWQWRFFPVEAAVSPLSTSSATRNLVSFYLFIDSPALYFMSYFAPDEFF